MEKQIGSAALMVTLCIVFTLSCAHGGSHSAGALTASDYFPRAVGNTWTYEMKMLGEAHELVVQQVEKRDGYFVDSTGAQLTVDSYGVRDDKRYLLREPLEVGTTWNNVVSVSSTERYRIAQVDVPCESARQKFQNCVIVESRNRVKDSTQLVNEVTFAPSVGVVHVRTTLENNGNIVPQSELTLKSYALKVAQVTAVEK